jgi:hypothetical protein
MMTAPPPPIRKRSFIRWVVQTLSRLVLFMTATLLLFVASLALVIAVAMRLSGYQAVDATTIVEGIQQIALAEIGESPRITAAPLSNNSPICEDVPRNLQTPLKRGFALMRGTDEGERLYDQLLAAGVCVTVGDLDFNAAYASARRTGFDDWSESRIVIDRELVRSTSVDLLAAIMIHEATHIDRAVSGEACFLTNECVRLPNGVEIEEELAAHTAEAEWWIAAFGEDGKRFAWRGDHGENALVQAYLAGEDAFLAYVADYRSDPREGDGLPAYNPR